MAASLFIIYGIVFFPVIHSQIKVHHFINLNVTWTAARQYCREHYTDLATVDTKEDLQHMLVPKGAAAWIGLFDDPASWYKAMTTDSNSWRWSATGDRGTGGFMQGWGINQPNFSRANNMCTILEPKLGWNDYVCSAKYQAACYTVESSVKQFNISDIALTWAQARDHCRQMYHDLAMIESSAENQEVQSWDKNVWIGLHREPWRWSDNSNSSFRKWRFGEPNNENGIEHCVTLGSDSYWKDEDCEHHLPFICYEAPRTKKFFQLKLQSAADLSDLTINSQIVQAINMKLGVNVTYFKIKRVRP